MKYFCSTYRELCDEYHREIIHHVNIFFVIYSKTPIYRGVWGQGNTRGKSGSAVNRGFVWFTLCMFSPICGKGNGRGISGFAVNRGAVNRGAVNRGFTVIAYIPSLGNCLLCSTNTLPTHFGIISPWRVATPSKGSLCYHLMGQPGSAISLSPKNTNNNM